MGKFENFLQLNSNYFAIVAKLNNNLSLYKIPVKFSNIKYFRHKNTQNMFTFLTLRHFYVLKNHILSRFKNGIFTYLEANKRPIKVFTNITI